MMAGLTVSLPPGCTAERAWIVDVLLGEFLGLRYRMVSGKPGVVEITGEDRHLEIADVFFPLAAAHWLEVASLPIEPLARLTRIDDQQGLGRAGIDLPVLYGNTNTNISEERIHFGFDLFGTAFFLLSRYEEAIVDERDEYDRFPARASLAFREGFLNRPIINEYLEVLWHAMSRLWLGLERRSHGFEVQVSADVDAPYCHGVKSLYHALRRSAGDLVKRRNPLQAVATNLNHFAFSRGHYYLDPHYRYFDWIMDENEKVGNRVTFYFIADHTSDDKDGCYELTEPAIIDLIRRIDSRGHEIGLHPSFNTYKDCDQTVREADRLRLVLEREVPRQAAIGTRQHYLRWDVMYTPSNHEAAGLTHDASLSFADHAGFRSGTCYEYTMYSLADRRPLAVAARPLVVMECTVIDKMYMNLGAGTAAASYIDELKDTCRLYGGIFSILWHNSRLSTAGERKLYSSSIS